MNFVLKTRNFVARTRNFVLKILNFAVHPKTMIMRVTFADGTYADDIAQNDPLLRLLLSASGGGGGGGGGSGVWKRRNGNGRNAQRQHQVMNFALKMMNPASKLMKFA